MKSQMIPYLLLILLFGVGWFFFFGRAIKYDAKARSLKKVKYWTNNCTFFPWMALFYVVSRYFAKKSKFKCKHPIRYKLISYLFFFTAVVFVLLIILVVSHMEKIGLITVDL